MIVPACDRPTVAVPIRAQGRHVMESESAAMHRKIRQQACQLPITGFAHNATVERDANQTTAVALLDMAAEPCSTARLNGAHDATLSAGEPLSLGVAEGSAVETENIRHFQCGTHYRPLSGRHHCVS
jgi:hypothetical protein